MIEACSVKNTGNHLLDALPQRERSRLSFVDVSLSVGEVLCECEQHVNWAYFPTSCLVSCLNTTKEGTTVETALIGNDGMFGVALFLTGGRSSARATIQVAGHALRISARTLQSEFTQAGAVQQTLLRYTGELLTQVTQSAICNRLHPLEQRMCKWLLLCCDRAGRDHFLVTQEVMANMLGGRRESVTVIAGHLQKLGAIRYSRGHIQILNRPLMEQLACECYGVVTKRQGNISGPRTLSPAPFRCRPVVEDQLSCAVG